MRSFAQGLTVIKLGLEPCLSESEEDSLDSGCLQSVQQYTKWCCLRPAVLMPGYQAHHRPPSPSLILCLLLLFWPFFPSSFLIHSGSRSLLYLPPAFNTQPPNKAAFRPPLHPSSICTPTPVLHQWILRPVFPSLSPCQPPSDRSEVISVCLSLHCHQEKPNCDI